ncbi:hypothetical protein WJX82_004486 [Trebouxia sp. C0006]
MKAYQQPSSPSRGGVLADRIGNFRRSPPAPRVDRHSITEGLTQFWWQNGPKSPQQTSNELPKKRSLFPVHVMEYTDEGVKDRTHPALSAKALQRLAASNPKLYKALLGMKKNSHGCISTATLMQVQAAMEAELPSKKASPEHKVLQTNEFLPASDLAANEGSMASLFAQVQQLQTAVTALTSQPHLDGDEQSGEEDDWGHGIIGSGIRVEELSQTARQVSRQLDKALRDFLSQMRSPSPDNDPEDQLDSSDPEMNSTAAVKSPVRTPAMAAMASGYGRPLHGYGRPPAVPSGSWSAAAQERQEWLTGRGGPPHVMPRHPPIVPSMGQIQCLRDDGAPEVAAPGSGLLPPNALHRPAHVLTQQHRPRWPPGPLFGQADAHKQSKSAAVPQSKGYIPRQQHHAHAQPIMRQAMYSDRQHPVPQSAYFGPLPAAHHQQHMYQNGQQMHAQPKQQYAGSGPVPQRQSTHMFGGQRHSGMHPQVSPSYQP